MQHTTLEKSEQRQLGNTQQYTGADVLEIMDGAKNYNNYLKSEVLRFLDQNVTTLVTQPDHLPILDFGAGSGMMASLLNDAGVRVLCLEPDTYLRQKLAHNKLATISSLADVATGSIKLVYSLNVLEHIEDDVAILKQLKTKMSPDGRLFLYVPAFQSLYSNFDRKLGHFRRYSKQQLIQVVQDAGFEITKAHYADSLGFLAAWLYQKISDQDGTVSIRSVVIYDTIVFPISRLLDRLFKPIIGKNLLLTAKIRS